MLSQLYTGGVDTSIFRAGTLTVGFAEGLKAFWGAVDDAFVYVWG